LAKVKEWFDVHIVDGAVNGLGYTVWSFGALIRQAQTGRVQLYCFFIVFGIVLMLLIKVV
jgi:NADH:ubiquinone oxidoreductase subunit 5 (subunit L)/multisubunit Na+/H+ antiporter MnhA subunit